jgi:hypothetical protein
MVPRRADRWASCTRKGARYRTETAAIRAAIELEQRVETSFVQAYECAYCPPWTDPQGQPNPWWHIGHKPGLRNKIVRRRAYWQTRNDPLDQQVYGERVTACANQENRGTDNQRTTYIRQLAQNAQHKANLNQWAETTPEAHERIHQMRQSSQHPPKTTARGTFM